MMEGIYYPPPLTYMGNEQPLEDRKKGINDMASSVSISVTVTDADGATSTATVSAMLDSITITSITVTPATAPAGTSRTLKISATSAVGAALTFGTPVGTGLTFTAVSGQPAGSAAWTFVY